VLALVMLFHAALWDKPKPGIRKKFISYECGFTFTYQQFDVKFCLVAILFILFDIEVVFFTLSATLSQLNLLILSMIDFIRTRYWFHTFEKMQALEW
jgi:NADH:ubiquinone oxidoreductase subunit 3 (subunit A)